MAKPLEGTIVADFTHVMAGPFASHLLRLLGATVIKIESPGRGDAMRYYGADRSHDGMAPAFMAVNAGKKSIALNLKDPEHKAVADDIIARSDVLIENFRPGVMTRLGLGYDRARELSPRIVYCSLSGYGQSGPLRDWPAIDNIVQATSGMMSLGGNPEDPPMRVGFPVVDTLTGQTAAFAILAALLRRGREGESEYIDVAMLDATLAFMTSAVVPYLITGKALERTGNVGYSGQPTSAVFEAGDGRRISLGVVQQNQFVSLARFLDKTEWLDDPRFKDPELRRQNTKDMQIELAAALRTRSAADWEREMSAAGIPCGMVREVAEAADFEHLRSRDLLLDIPRPDASDGSSVRVINAGFSMEREGPGLQEAPPKLGEHAAEILEWLGYDPCHLDSA